MIVSRRSLKAVGGNITVEKTTNFLRMDALENVRLRCTGYRSERSRNGRRVPREGRQFIASPQEDGSRGCTGREINVKNTVSISPLGKPSLEILYIFIFKPRRVVGNADVNEMEIPSGVLKYLWKIVICRQRNDEKIFPAKHRKSLQDSSCY